jgi:hypothetical protein
MPGDIFVKGHAEETLDQFAERLRPLLGIVELEQRDSSNYVNDKYFVGRALGLEIVFAQSDEEDLDGYEFWIYIRTRAAWIPDSSFIDGLSDLLARHLTLSGEAVVRLPTAHRTGGLKIFYDLYDGPAVEWADRVTTRDVPR